MLLGKKEEEEIVPCQWDIAQENALQTLKEKLSSHPVLAYADFTKPFILHTDASTEGLGAVLYQEQSMLLSRSKKNNVYQYKP